MPIQATVGLGASQQRLYDSLPARPMSITSGKFVSLTTHFTEGRGKVNLQRGSAKHLGGRPCLTTVYDCMPWSHLATSWKQLLIQGEH